MNQLTHIGLDVHKGTIAVAVLRPDTVVCDERVIPNTPRRCAGCSPATPTHRSSLPATRRDRPPSLPGRSAVTQMPNTPRCGVYAFRITRRPMATPMPPGSA